MFIPYIPVYYERLALSTTTPTGLNAAYYHPSTGDYAGKWALMVVLGVEGGAIRYQLVPDGPLDSTTGFPLAAGEHVFYFGPAQLANFKALALQADTVLHVFYCFAPPDREVVIPTPIV